MIRGMELMGGACRIESVLELLADDSIDEEDMPEALKDLLSSLLAANDSVRLLPLLHSYRS